ncbi:TolC family protein [Hydrogenophaga sp.]|uniref:TolC family protein n=1 Tax=Hydrogenophaga sp. TaxID=1904254 RepID=UPI002FCA93D9
MRDLKMNKAGWIVGALVALALPALAQAPATEADWVRMALERDAILAAQRDDTRAAGQAVAVSRAGLWPTVQLSAEDGRRERRDRPASIFQPHTGSRPSDQQSLTVTQLLYDGQRTRNEIQSAEHRVSQQQVRLQKVANERAAAVLQAWHQWRSAQVAWQAHRVAEAELRQLVDVVTQRLQAGRAAEVDLRRAESRWLDGQRTVAESQARWREAGVALSSLSGVDPQPDTPPPTFNPLEPSAANALREHCRTECPSVQESMLQLERGRAELAAARAGHHPRITLEAAQAHARNPTGTAERYLSRSLMLKANWTLFEGGGRSAQVAQVAHSVEGLAHQVDEARRESLMQFDQALVRYDDAIAQHALATRTASVSREALRLARLAFEAGRRQAIEVADVIAEAARAADEAARRDAQRWIERDRLLATAGVLLDQLGVVLAPA